MNSKKVFKIKTLSLVKNTTVTIRKSHPLRKHMTTRTLYPGKHLLEIQINGNIVAKKSFTLIASNAPYLSMKQYTTDEWDGKLILLATILASGMAFLDGSIVNIAIPTIQQVFGATIGQIQWVVNAYSLILGSLMLISGALGDRLGRKKVFMTGIVVFTVSSLLCSFSPSIFFLIIARGLQGVGAALMTPGSLSIINSSFAHSVRGRAIGLWSGFAGGLAALGPFLGGYLVQTFGWPSIFYINLPIGILTLDVLPISSELRPR